ncbi:twin-arginine translocation signal domain-containing protein [Natrialbaceae archaeon A-arb3/5]
MSGINRRNFVKGASAAAAAGLAGCMSGNGDGDASELEWIGPDWAARDSQAEKYAELTDDEVNITTATIPTVQQRLLGGENSEIDAYSAETSGSGALADVTIPTPTEELDNWDEDVISDAFTNPGERLDYLGAQTDTINDLLWADDEQTELQFPPHAFNFDAVGYNPKYVDDASLWSALFDEQYEGESLIGETAAITIPQALMHLLDNDMVDGDVGDLNNPSQEQLDAAIDFLVEEKEEGQFRTTWEAYGESVTQMASEEAIISDVWQPAAMDIRRDGTPCTYATMDDGIQGYRYWFGGISPVDPAARERGTLERVWSLLDDVHYGAWYPRFVQGWGYSVPHYENEELVRDGSDESGDGMGPEYYDWAYRGEATYDEVDEPALFDPQEYDWSDEEGEPHSDGSVRDSGPIEERFDRVGFFQIWPDEADYMQDRWSEFLAA